MARRRKGLFMNVLNLSIIMLAMFGGWTLYQRNKLEVQHITERAVKNGRKAAHKFSKSLMSLHIKDSVWRCWFNATEKALETCRAKNSCLGVGAWGAHSQRREAYDLAKTKCVAEYGECVFDYCSEE